MKKEDSRNRAAQNAGRFCGGETGGTQSFMRDFSKSFSYLLLRKSKCQTKIGNFFLKSIDNYLIV